MSQFQPPPAPVLPYATPVAYQSATPAMGPWRDGAQLVTTRNMALPVQCVKCNGGTEGFTMRKSFYWHNPALYVMILVPGVLIYAIVAMIVRKKAVVEFGLCPTHRKRRTRMIFAAWMVALLAVIEIVITCILGSSRSTEDYVPFFVFGIIITVIASLIVGMVGARTLTPAAMDANFAWFKGAGNDFLETLPPVQ